MLRIKVDVDFFNTGLSGCQLICALIREFYVSNSCKPALGVGHRYGVNNALQGPLCLVRFQGSGSTKCLSNISGFQSPWQRSVAYARFARSSVARLLSLPNGWVFATSEGSPALLHCVSRGTALNLARQCR